MIAMLQQESCVGHRSTDHMVMLYYPLNPPVHHPSNLFAGLNALTQRLLGSHWARSAAAHEFASYNQQQEQHGADRPEAAALRRFGLGGRMQGRSQAAVRHGPSISVLRSFLGRVCRARPIAGLAEARLLVGLGKLPRPRGPVLCVIHRARRGCHACLERQAGLVQQHTRELSQRHSAVLLAQLVAGLCRTSRDEQRGQLSPFSVIVLAGPILMHCYMQRPHVHTCSSCWASPFAAVTHGTCTNSECQRGPVARERCSERNSR